MRSDGHGNEKVERAAVSVSQRNKAEFRVAAEKDFQFSTADHIACEVVACEHHTFAETCRPGCIVDLNYIFILDIGVMNVIFRESFRIVFDHLIIHAEQKLLDGFAVALMQAAEVSEREDTADLFDLVLFQIIPDAVADEKENRFGMVDNMMDIIRIKVLKNRHDDGSVRDRGHENHAPMHGIFSDQCNAVAFSDLAFLE